MKNTSVTFKEMKQKGEKISMLTSYDYTMTGIVDRAGIDAILVGDSASNVMAGTATTLPMTVEKKILEGQGIYFQRGPLLFAYPIPQKTEEDTEVYENMHGKESENPDFKCWNITPTGDFNYAYDDDGHPVAVNYPAIEEINGTIPFDLLYTTVKLRVPVKQIKWDLVDNRYTPHLPEQGHLTLLDDERTYIELVPYGCTELRLTVFPDTKAQPSEQPAPVPLIREKKSLVCVAYI